MPKITDLWRLGHPPSAGDDDNAMPFRRWLVDRLHALQRTLRDLHLYIEQPFVRLDGVTAPPTSASSATHLYSDETAAGNGDVQLYALLANGATNRLTGLTVRNTAQFDVTSSTTLAEVLGLSVKVEAGRVYEFVAVLRTASDSAGGVKAAIGGTATAASVAYDGLTINAGAITQGRSTALGGPVGGVTAVTAALMLVWGVIDVATDGTLRVEFGQNASSAVASSVLVNSSFALRPVG